MIGFEFIHQSELIKPVEKKQVWIELDPIRPKAELKKKSKNKDSIISQIVQTSPGDRVETPVPDAFLGEHTQKVEEQTVSKNKRTVIGKQGETTSKMSSLENQNVDQKKASSASLKELEKESTTNFQKETLPNRLSKLGVPLFSKLRQHRGHDSEKGENSFSTLGTIPEDYVNNLKESDRTALNTKEYQFFGYFQRIRERLDRAWVPILRKRLVSYYRNGRQLASDRDFSTKILVTLSEKGQIIRVRLMVESGTQDLDEAAIEAFNQAGPFPNPPRGIVDSNHEIIVPWNFVLKT